MNTQGPRGRGSALFALVISCFWLLSGCGIFDEGDPERARVIMEGGEGHPIQLVTTADFVVTTSQDGEERDLYIYSADTSAVTSPFDTKYSLGSRRRFYATLSSSEVAPEPVLVRIYIDSDLRYERSTVFGDEVLEFLFSVR